MLKRAGTFYVKHILKMLGVYTASPEYDLQGPKV